MNYAQKNFGNADALQERESSFFAPDFIARAKMNDLYTRLRDDPRDADLKGKIENNPELSFQMFLNPRAINPIPENFLNNITCWHCKKYGDGAEWKKL
jgi:hypothetical protein